MAQGGSGGRDTIAQRIALEGGVEVKQQLADIGQAGEKAFKQIQDASATSSGPLSRLGAGVAGIFASFRSAGEAFKPVAESLGNLRNSFGAFSAEMSVVANNILPHFNEIFALGIAGAVLGVERLVVASSNSVIATKNAADAINFSLKNYEALSLVAEKAGVDHEKLDAMMSRFAVTVGKAREEVLKAAGEGLRFDGVLRGGTVSADSLGNAVTGVSDSVTVLRGGVAALAKLSDPLAVLGIHVKNFADNQAGQAALFLATAKALDTIGTSSVKAAAASQMFGRGWREMSPVFKDLANNMMAADREIEKLGIGISPEESANARSFKAAYTELGAVIKRTGEIVGNMIGGAVAPALLAFKNLIGANLQTLLGWGNSVAVTLASILDDFAKMAAGVDDTKIENKSLIGFRDFLFTLGRGLKDSFDQTMRVLGGLADLINSVFGTHLTGPILLGMLIVEKLSGTLGLVVAAMKLVWSAGVAMGTALSWAGFQLAEMGVAGAIAGAELLLLVGIIAAIGVALLLLFGPMDQVSAQIRQVFGDDAANAFDKFRASFRDLAVWWFSDFNALLDSIGNLWTSAWTALGVWLKGQIEEIAAFFHPLIAAIQTVLDLWTKIYALSPAGGAAPPIPGGPPAGGFATGGRVPGSGTGDTVRALLTPGEFVQRVAAVRHYGLDFMQRINTLQVPKFDMGGLVGALSHVDSGVQRFAGGGLVGAVTGAGSGSTINLTIGSETFAGLMAPRAVAEKLVTFARGESVRSTGKKASWAR